MIRRPEYDDEVPIKPPVQIGQAIVPVIDRLTIAYTLNPETESPIETILGAELLLRAQDEPSIQFKPQYVWRRYRIDWAALHSESKKPLAFVECDGRDYHTSDQQRARDASRDAECASAGIKVFRFTGSEINRASRWCADQVFDHLREAVCP